MRQLLQQLRTMQPGEGFVLPALQVKGIVRDVGDCDVAVSTVHDETHEVRLQRWSPHTAVIPCKMNESDLTPPAQRRDLTYVCACGKECTSKSGLTLHKQNCLAAQREAAGVTD